MLSVMKAGVLHILFLISASEQLSPLAFDVLQAFASTSSSVAVICSPEHAALLRKFSAASSLSFTTWDILGKSGSFEHFTGYVKQGDTTFPRPGVVFVCLLEGQDLQALRSTVAAFERFHSNIQWIFAERQHQQALNAFSGHLCQVISVTENEINAPLDGYRSCQERRLLLVAEDAALTEIIPRAGTYPKHGRVLFGVMDQQSTQCMRNDSFIQLMWRVYAAFNSSLVEVCNHGDTDSLLLDRRVDFVMATGMRVPLSSYYGYVMPPRSSFCFLSRGATPLRPSFLSTWMSFLQISLVLFPLASVILLVVAAQARRRSVGTDIHSGLIMFFVSTYLGRSPEGLVKYKSTVVSVSIITWMFAMLILQQYTQTEITASRSVPALSPGMRTAAEFMSRLDSGSILPCVHFITYDIIDKLGSKGSPLKSLRRALRECGSKCVTHNFDDCFHLAESGTHALVAECSTVQARSRFGSRLVASDEALVSFLMCYPTHTRFPRRYQQRRLLRALHESGLYTKYLTKEVPPPISGDLASFDIPFTEYVAVYALGCGLSLVAFAAEVLRKQCGHKRRRLVPRLCKWLERRADVLPSVDSPPDALAQAPME